MDQPSHLAVLFGFKGGKEIGLVKGGCENPADWDFPCISLADENPVVETIERKLKEAHFKDIAIEGLKRVVPQELGEGAGSAFGNTCMFMFNIIRAQSMGLGRVFFVKRIRQGSGLDSLNAFGLPGLSDRARLVLESDFVQSRL